MSLFPNKHIRASERKSPHPGMNPIKRQTCTCCVCTLVWWQLANIHAWQLDYCHCCVISISFTRDKQNVTCNQLTMSDGILRKAKKTSHCAVGVLTEISGANLWLLQRATEEEETAGTLILFRQSLVHSFLWFQHPSPMCIPCYKINGA